MSETNVAIPWRNLNIHPLAMDYFVILLGLQEYKKTSIIQDFFLLCISSLFSDLPVHKFSQILLFTIFIRTKSLSKEYKYTLAEDMKKRAFEFLLEIYRANRNASQTLLHINTARDHIEFLRLSFRILQEMKQISIPHFVAVSSEVNEVSKQLNAWAKYEEGRE